jgi:hypothetical protein
VCEADAPHTYPSSTDDYTCQFLGVCRVVRCLAFLAFFFPF